MKSESAPFQSFIPLEEREKNEVDRIRQRAKEATDVIVEWENQNVAAFQGSCNHKHLFSKDPLAPHQRTRRFLILTYDDSHIPKPDGSDLKLALASCLYCSQPKQIYANQCPVCLSATARDTTSYKEKPTLHPDIIEELGNSYCKFSWDTGESLFGCTSILICTDAKCGFRIAVLDCCVQ